MSASGTTPGAAFRAKAALMKTWRPETSPSNRDRLELYALHKQVLSGDAPMKNPPDASVADKAKMNAWRTKRGMTQVEAMSRYVSECDRQLRVYGSKSSSTTAPTGDAFSSASDTPAGGGGRGSGTRTPTNTPATGNDENDNDDNSEEEETILLTPRGLAAVPLLCAAAAESRPSYLARLRATGPPSNGWWAKQEPLCAEPNSFVATPENLVIGCAAKVEYVSLSLTLSQRGGSSSSSTETRANGNVDHGLPVPPAVLQSFLWPAHNVLLVVWIVLIFICTLIGSAFLTIRTILLGSKRTHVRLDQIFNDEIGPCSRVASSLCEPHQAITVRLSGLMLMPLVTLCDIARAVCDGGGQLVGGGVYVAALVITWWYWICVLPCAAFWGVFWSLMLGWCFALIELAGV
uniref:ACB domain-containing protein n=1 Tax=Helicotheca tamesis TaxID=374047 RepID=A0A7S2E1J9_9STRA|mmetsp:Transcript_11243/g.15581  ORF Transcript_11243/g.15581 Transcript_11243/m.15581 type:complete len:405 (+) Transcript_11243:175-1389(+)|eukprot:CAMPEP_0185736408 /NCGR_PEP_ID=MMETSP1171-20130828/27790_1 /TAXON_ID=374046 /ORGANISM="Helicotheca tamensis, Strain CCMP826" /LENGTH=404 /DNA_ID=CAMNT_0028407019 /DNA_START=166 /DNA_END=1380 /DNA_ORIENTATION=+